MINLPLFQSRAEAIDWAYKKGMSVWSDSSSYIEAKSKTSTYRLTTFKSSKYEDIPVAHYWYENYRIIPKSQSVNSNRRKKRQSNV